MPIFFPTWTCLSSLVLDKLPSDPFYQKTNNRHPLLSPQRHGDSEWIYPGLSRDLDFTADISVWIIYVIAP